MREIGVLEAKTNLSALISEVETGGEPVLITRHGKPVAQLSPVAQSDPMRRPRKLSAAELAIRFQALRDSQPSNPELDKLTWDDLKKMARE